MMLPTRYFAFLNRTGTLVRAAVCCGVGVAFLSMASAPAFAAEMNNLKAQLRDLQNRLDQIESQQAAPPVVPKKMVRSGKSAVKLTLSGQVSRLVMWAEDGVTDGIFHSDNSASSTRWRLRGKAKINNEWTIGTVIEQDIELNETGQIDLLDKFSEGTAEFDQRLFSIYFDNKNAGRLTIGKGNPASNGTSEKDLSGTFIAGYAGIADIAGGLKFRVSGVSGTNPATTSIGSAWGNQNDGISRRNRIRYDTPTFAGFKLSASHQQEGSAAVALTYAAKYKQAGLKVSAAIAYSDSLKDDVTNGSISVLHSSGVSVTFSAGARDRDDGRTSDHQYVKIGFQTPMDLGKLYLSGDYGRHDERNAADDEFETWGLQVVQKIDKAATELYLGFRNHQLELGTGVDTHDINVVYAGARVKF